MDSVSNEQLFSAIVSSNILAPYLTADQELSALLENPNHCNIHYPRIASSVTQIQSLLEGMLNYMTSQRIYLNIEATKQLISFGEKNPEGEIYDVTFNCEKQSYGVCCGQTEDQLHVICVLTGQHIPDELFGDSTS